MSFEPRKYNDIFEAMRASDAANGLITDFEVGSVARTITESFAYELALLYEKMRLVYLSAYVDTAVGQQLDMVVSILGIQRGEPDYAQGVVTFQRDVSNDDIEVPVGTLVATVDKPGAPKKAYQTVEPATLHKGQTSADVRVQALQRGEEQATPAATIVAMPRPIPGVKSVTNTNPIAFTGKRGETDDELRERAKNTLISAGKATLIAIENALLSLQYVDDVRVIEYFDPTNPKYGLIDVFVDGVDLSDAATKSQVSAAIDNVRAAGIFARLQQATPLNVEAVFQVGVKPDLKLTPDERAQLEGRIADNVRSYIQGLKMGQSLLLSQIIKSILAVDGVTDLVKYDIDVNGTAVFQGADRSLSSNPSERFKPALLCVASETKNLPIDVTFKANAGLTAGSLAAARTALNAYLVDLQPGDTVVAAELLSRISSAGITPDPSTLLLVPRSWCGPARRSGNDVITRFVEKAALGDVFAYSSVLKITGALKLVMAPKLTDAQKDAAISQVRLKLNDALAALKPDEDVILNSLVAAAKTVDQVWDAQVNANDFRARMEGVAADIPGRVSAAKVDVQAFEKASLDNNFCITDAVRVVTVTITGLQVTAVVPGKDPVDPNLTKLQNQFKNDIAGKALLTGIAAGQSVDYNAVKTAIESLIPGASPTVTAMTITATADCDGRSQTASAPGSSIHVRSVEIASVTPIAGAEVSVTVKGTQGNA